MPKFIAMPAESRFWNRVNKEGPIAKAGLSRCHIWLGKPQANGYGRIKYLGKLIGAHRFAWFMRHGSMAPDNVCHTCDVRLCVNVDPMFNGTTADNMADKNEKLRQAKGSVHGRSKLTEGDVIEMRRRMASGESVTEVAYAYAISIPNN